MVLMAPAQTVNFRETGGRPREILQTLGWPMSLDRLIESLWGWHDNKGRAFVGLTSRWGDGGDLCIRISFFLQPHRISVRSVLVNRKTSKDAACTMIIGRGAPLGPSCVKASAVTHSSSIISWLPSNSNFQHTVCINNVEVKTLRPGTFKHMITGNLLIYIQSE